MTSIKCTTWTENGAIKMPASKRAEIDAFYRKYADRSIEIKFSLLPKRSNNENRFYWGVVVQLVMERMNEYGNEWDKKQTHAFLLDEFSPVDVLGPGGEVIGTKGGRSSDKNSEEFSDEYIEKIRRFAAEKLELIIPYPNEQSILFAEFDHVNNLTLITPE